MIGVRPDIEALQETGCSRSVNRVRCILACDRGESGDHGSQSDDGDPTPDIGHGHRARAKRGVVVFTLLPHVVLPL